MKYYPFSGSDPTNSNRMKKTSFFFLLIFFLSFQSGDYKLKYSIPFTDVKFFTTDNLGNAYVITGNQLLRFNQDGKPSLNFSESTLGELRSVDASDPLKTILFYPDFGRLILLNSQLAVQSAVHLKEIGIYQPMLACGSAYGGYWIFDRQDFQLKKVDLNLRIAFQSGEMMNVTGINVNPDFITEYNGSVYLKDPRNGLFVFDRFGTYHKRIPLGEVTSFQVIENEILYVSSDTLKAYHLKTLNEREILLPAHGAIKSARIENSQLYLLTSDSLAFYSF